MEGGKDKNGEADRGFHGGGYPGGYPASPGYPGYPVPVGTYPPTQGYAPPPGHYSPPGAYPQPGGYQPSHVAYPPSGYPSGYPQHPTAYPPAGYPGQAPPMQVPPHGMSYLHFLYTPLPSNTCSLVEKNA